MAPLDVAKTASMVTGSYTLSVFSLLTRQGNAESPARQWTGPHQFGFIFFLFKILTDDFLLQPD